MPKRPEKPDELWLLWDRDAEDFATTALEEADGMLAYRTQEAAQDAIAEICKDWDKPYLPVRVF
jgi:hypothetical protein